MQTMFEARISRSLRHLPLINRTVAMLSCQDKFGCKKRLFKSSIFFANAKPPTHFLVRRQSALSVVCCKLGNSSSLFDSQKRSKRRIIDQGNAVLRLQQ